MEHIKQSQSTPHQNGEACIAHEYASEEPDINGAVIELTGRYPETGRAVNTVSKEQVFVLEGVGICAVDDQKVALAQGDQLLIQPGEKYYFDGSLRLYIACTPAWTPQQHEYTD